MGVIRSKNLAVLDLVGATDLGGGWHRLFIYGGGVTLDYQPSSGLFRLNGTAAPGTNEYNITLLEHNTMSLSYIYHSGSINAGTMAFNNRARYNWISRGPSNYFNNTQFTRSDIVIDNILSIWINNNNIFDNFTFKLQLEKGDTATPYTKPFTPLRANQVKHYIESKNLAMPDLNGKPEFNLDIPIVELNGHTLREVFETNNQFYNLINSATYDPSTKIFTATGQYPRIGVSSGISGNTYYMSVDYQLINLSSVSAVYRNIGGSGYNVVWKNPDALRNKLSSIFIKPNNLEMRSFYPVLNNTPVSPVDIAYLYSSNIIDMTGLGVQNLTKEQMDYWFNIYQALSNGERVYRLYNANGITLDYNIINGEYNINGSAASDGGYFISNNNYLTIFPIHSESTISLTYERGYSSDSPYSFIGILSSAWDDNNVVRLANSDTSEKRVYTTTQLRYFRIFINSGHVFSDYTFKLQLEKGSTATVYEVPFIPYFAKTKKIVIPPKNLAMPDLNGKPDLGDGIYRLYNTNGITIDYELSSGEYVMNGQAINSIWGIPIGVTNSYNGSYYTQPYYISGTNVGTLYIYPYTNKVPTPNYAWINSSQSANGFQFDLVTNGRLEFGFASGTNFINFKFKIQIEQGSAATDYEKPRNTITYNPDFNMEVTNND